MNKVLACIAMTVVAAGVHAQDCDCTKYPFTPNPPCFNKCVEKLAAKAPAEAASGVRGIDPGVYVGIRVLSETKAKAVVDFSRIKDKAGLEREASKAMKSVGKNL